MTTIVELAPTVIGTDRIITATFYDSAGDLEDITGHTINFWAWEEGTALEIAKSTGGSGITILAQTGATLGQAQITIEPADTLQWSANVRLRIELEKTTGGGLVDVPVVGKWRLLDKH